MQKFLILIGLIIVLIGVAYPILKKLPIGRLPGDIFYSSDKVTFVFPIITCIILSILISFLFNIFK
jgi:hypothetical protein